MQVAAAKEESHKLEEQLSLGAVRLKQARLEGNQLQAQVVEVSARPDRCANDLANCALDIMPSEPAWPS